MPHIICPWGLIRVLSMGRYNIKVRQEIESERVVISKAQRYGTWQRLLDLLKSLQFNWAGTMTAKFRYRLHHVRNMVLLK